MVVTGIMVNCVYPLFYQESVIFGVLWFVMSGIGLKLKSPISMVGIVVSVITEYI